MYHPQHHSLARQSLKPEIHASQHWWYAIHVPEETHKIGKSSSKESSQQVVDDAEGGDNRHIVAASSNIGGLYRCYEEIRPLIESGQTRAYRRCSSKEVAEHFVAHGVLPVSVQNVNATKHIFIYVTDKKYSLFFDFTWPRGDKKSFVSTVPLEWADLPSGSQQEEKDRCNSSSNNSSRSHRHSITRDLTSLLALSKCLEIISCRFPKEWSVLIHFEYHYAYNCITKWIAKWKRDGWEGRRIQYKVLAQILDHQKRVLPNVFFHYVPNKEMVKGIGGFVEAKRRCHRHFCPPHSIVQKATAAAGGAQP